MIFLCVKIYCVLKTKQLPQQELVQKNKGFKNEGALRMEAPAQGILLFGVASP